jgi:NADH-quinone oxidoreductase subunit N
MGYAVMTLGSFGVLSMFEKSEGTDLEVKDLKGLASRYPIAALCLSLLLLSLAGIPPTVGFFGKFFLFSAALKQGFFWVAVWGVLSSAVSVYYYLRPIVYMYMTEGEALQAPTGRQLSKIVVTACAILVVVVGLISNPVYDAIRKSVAGLF